MQLFVAVFFLLFYFFREWHCADHVSENGMAIKDIVSHIDVVYSLHVHEGLRNVHQAKVSHVQYVFNSVKLSSSRL